MEHPLIGNIDTLTVDQLSEKVSDLYKKLGIAAKSGNGHLCHQLRMAIETYETKYREKLTDQYRQQVGNTNFDDKINIQ